MHKYIYIKFYTNKRSTTKIATEKENDSFPMKFTILGKEARGYYDHTNFLLEDEQNPSTILMFNKEDLLKSPPFNKITYNMQNSANAGYGTLEKSDAKVSLSISLAKLSTSFCDDRFYKFKKHVKNEDRLQKIIDKSHGVKREKPKLTERNIVDLEVWKFLPETNDKY